MTDPTDAPVFRGRARATVPATRETVDVDLEIAQSVARATACLPDAYRQQPGAVLLAKSWADAHDLPLLTAIQWVSFVKGRPVIDATAQRALAVRHGYTVDVTEADGSATVTLNRPEWPAAKSTTYTLADAKAAELTGKDNWRKNPRAMLVARATSTAIRNHAPEVLLGVMTQDEAETAGDPATILATATVDPPAEAAQAPEPQVEEVPDDAVELVDEPAAPANVDAAAVAADGVARIRAAGRYQELSESMKGAGIPLQRSRWTDDHAALIAELVADLEAAS